MTTLNIHLLFILITYLPCVNSTISNNFYNYVQQKFGQQTAQQLARTDFGESGSFGGGNHLAETKTNKLPIIFVHGYMTSAKNTKVMADYFKQNYGYSDEELYATTFGSPGIIPVQKAMNCEYVKAIRNMIIAVSGFTNSAVNVIAYSMGSPVSRKAIMGGTCVDTNENIGPVATSYVNAFLGVAGANFGISNCFLSFGICNRLNGLHCQSQFLRDINSRSHYEGNRVYAMLSTSDDIVGYQACGQIASSIPGADNTVTLNGLTHLQMCSPQTVRFVPPMVAFRNPHGPKSTSELLIAGVIILVVLTIIGSIICCFRFRRDRRKKKEAKNVIVENAKIGQKLTQQQAEALFDLNESWLRFTKNIGTNKKIPKLHSDAHAVLCVDYFRLERWSKRLRDAEEATDEKDLHKVLKRLAAEMEGHAELFQLQPDTKKQLREIANLPSQVVSFI